MIGPLPADMPPVSMFVFKVADTCNLDCGYCYMHMGRSDAAQRQAMPPEIARQAAVRTAEYAAANGLDQIEISLHGGEPLTLGTPHLRKLCDAIEEGAAGVRVRFGMQTNGVLFDAAALELCLEKKISVGLSLDGPRAVFDRHRPGPDGKSRFDQVLNALELLASPAGRGIWAGFLSVIDAQADPVETYRFLRAYAPPAIEFLLPLANHDHLPAGKHGFQTDAAYGLWLLEVFQAWYRERPQTTMIRRFLEIIKLAAGRASACEEFGLGGRGCLTITCDGALEAVDTLRAACPESCRLGCNVFERSISEALGRLKRRAEEEGWDETPPGCGDCALYHICGGGYLPHRWSRGEGFRRPTVYCSDLASLIEDVLETVNADLARLEAQNILELR